MDKPLPSLGDLNISTSLDSDDEDDDMLGFPSLVNLAPQKPEKLDSSLSDDELHESELFDLNMSNYESPYQISTELKDLIQEELEEETKRKEAENIYKECNEMDSLDIKSDIMNSACLAPSQRDVQILPKGINLFSRDKSMSIYKLKDLKWPFRDIKSKLPDLHALSNLSDKEVTEYIRHGKLNITFNKSKIIAKLPKYLMERITCTFDEEVMALQTSLNYFIDVNPYFIWPLVIRNFPTCISNLGGNLAANSLGVCPPSEGKSENQEDQIIPESYPYYNISVLIQILTHSLSNTNKPENDKEKIELMYKEMDLTLLILLAIGLDRMYMEVMPLAPVASCIGEILQFYPEEVFLDRIHELVELIIKWLVGVHAIDHHNARLICSTLLPKTPAGMVLKSSLAFSFLQYFLDTPDTIVCDIVYVQDVLELLEKSAEKIKMENNSYILYSYLILIDSAIRPCELDMNAKVKLQYTGELINHMLKSKIDSESEIDNKRLWGILKILINKWDNMASCETMDDFGEHLKFT